MAKGGEPPDCLEPSGTCRDWVLVFEPPATGGDLISGQAQEAIMSHWHDTMVERPETDGAVYATGWTVSGLAVLLTVVAVWMFGI